MKDPESLYYLLGRLIEERPDFSGYGPLTSEQNLWLGRACALVEAAGNVADAISIKAAAQFATGVLRSENIAAITSIIYQTFAAAELQAPADVQGAFIHAGNSFNAFAVIGKVLQRATKDALIVDPYMDEKALTNFGVLTPDGCSLRLLTDAADHKPSLQPAVAAWTGQHGSKRPLEARLAPAKTLHDRLIIVDGKTAYTLTQSLNAFAARSPASIVRVDPETSAMKVSAYASIWANAAPL